MISLEGVCEVVLVDLEVIPADDRDYMRSDRSLQWRLVGLLLLRDKSLLVINDPLVSVGSLQEAGISRSCEVHKLEVGKNLEGVCIKGHVISLM